MTKQLTDVDKQMNCYKSKSKHHHENVIKVFRTNFRLTSGDLCLDMWIESYSPRNFFNIYVVINRNYNNYYYYYLL